MKSSLSPSMQQPNVLRMWRPYSCDAGESCLSLVLDGTFIYELPQLEVEQGSTFDDRVMFSHLKPETARVQGASEATIRPAVTSQVSGDAISFASALGYVYVFCSILWLGLISCIERQSRSSNEATYSVEVPYQYRCSRWIM